MTPEGGRGQTPGGATTTHCLGVKSPSKNFMRRRLGVSVLGGIFLSLIGKLSIQDFADGDLLSGWPNNEMGACGKVWSGGQLYEADFRR